MQLYSHILGLL